MRGKVTYIFLCLLLSSSFHVSAQQIVSLEGQVMDAQTKEVLGFATVQLTAEDKTSFGAVTDGNGRYSFSHLTPGIYIVNASYLGYNKSEEKLQLLKNQTFSILLHVSPTSLNEVIVTASESKGLTSASKIDRTAMSHLQPTSFTDLLELLPGGKSTDPNMGKANLIRIREASSTSEGIASQGVAFQVDGMPINTDANMQYISGTTQGTDKESVSKGVDMRTISTDNIESVEIVRGIPSVEYGSLTNGMVIIQRKKTATPLTARFKADQYSKLFSVGKGVGLGSGNDILNIDLSYVDSKIDPRDSRETYKRMTASSRWYNNHSVGVNTMTWNMNLDYTGSFDNIKHDKDVTTKENRYKSSYNKISFGGEWNMLFAPQSFVRKLRAKVSFSQEFDKIDEVKSISPGPVAAPTSLVEGESDGIYLPNYYVGNMTIDGKPQYLNTGLYADFAFRWQEISHSLKAGIEWNYSKNLGNGQLCDMNLPLDPTATLRPRDYKSIPSMQKAGFFLEETMKYTLNGHRLSLVAGVRVFTLLNLTGAYTMKGKLYADPRINFQWKLPAMGKERDWFLSFSAGIGWLSLQPDMAQLYPDMKYQDLVQLNYYSSNPDFRRINLMTYKWDNTNYDLTPARNRKLEIRADLEYCGNNFSVTYFHEKMDNGFRDISYYRIMPYKLYDSGSIDGSTLTGPPDLNGVSYSQESLINVYSKVGNGARVRKEGVEFAFSSKRIELLKTRVSVNGAWLKTTYSNSMPTYKAASVLIGGKQLKYVGLYDWESGTEYQSFQTNFMLDTYLQRLGMTFSASAQCTWYTNNRNLWNSGLPTYYVDQEGIQHEFMEADKTDGQLQHLVVTYSGQYFERTTIPFAMNINLKATKAIGKYMDLALFVNRLLNVAPDYTRNEQLIRRSSSPYFGMEATLKF